MTHFAFPKQMSYKSVIFLERRTQGLHSFAGSNIVIELMPNIRQTDNKVEFKEVHIIFPISQNVKLKGKSVPLQAWTDPESSRKLKVVRLRDNGPEWW